MGAEWFEFKFDGDIEEFTKFTDPKILDGTFEREIRKATIKNCLIILKAIKTAIRERKYLENAPLTIALAGGRKDIPLLKTKNLVDSLAHKLHSSFMAEVGLIKDKRSTGGASKSPIKLMKVVELMHTGYIIKVTPKMRRAIAAALTEKTKTGKLTKKSKRNMTALSLAGTFNTDKETVYKVPKRPLFSDVFESKLLNREIQRNWREALERVWKVQGAQDGEEKDQGGDSPPTPPEED